jgi:hypothetical protein
MYHTHYRDYDWRTHRWDREDPAGYVDGLNLYAAYFDVNGVDPDGLSAKTEIKPIFDKNFNVVRYEAEWKSRMPFTPSVRESMMSNDFWQQPINLSTQNLDNPAFTHLEGLQVAGASGVGFLFGYAGGLMLPSVGSSLASSYAMSTKLMGDAVITGGGTAFIGINNFSYHAQRYANNAYNWWFRNPTLQYIPSGMSRSKRVDWARKHLRLSGKSMGEFVKNYNKFGDNSIYGDSRHKLFLEWSKFTYSRFYNQSTRFVNSSPFEILRDDFILGSYSHPALTSTSIVTPLDYYWALDGYQSEIPILKDLGDIKGIEDVIGVMGVIENYLDENFK